MTLLFVLSVMLVVLPLLLGGVGIYLTQVF